MENAVILVVLLLVCNSWMLTTGTSECSCIINVEQPRGEEVSLPNVDNEGEIINKHQMVPLISNMQEQLKLVTQDLLAVRQQLAQDKEVYEKNLKESQDNIIQQQEMLNKIEGRLSDTKNRVNEINNHTDAITSRLTNIEKENNQTDTRLCDLENDGEQQQEEITKLQEQIEKADHPNFVGCSVWLTAVQRVAGGETVIFGGITLNEGNHYQPLTGEFLCPVTGAYYAAVTGKADGTEQVYLAITRNGEEIVHTNEHDNTYNTVTTSCVMRCEAGDVISVTGYYTTSSVYGDTSVPYSAFTVMILHEGFDGLTSWKKSSQHYSVGEVVTFPEIIYESPNYAPSISRYVCPENGNYLVTLNIMKKYGADLHIGVEHKSHTVLSVADRVSGNSYNQVSNSVLVHCAHNETITVKATGTGSVYGTRSYKRTTFTIMQIHREGNSRQNRHSAFVGCSLWKKSTQVYATTDTIVYDGIALNSGNHFDRILNRFVCPYNGIYYVTATAKKHSTSDLRVNVLHATAILFRLEDLGSVMPNNTVSNSALVRCFTGEAIQVKAAGPGSIFGEYNGVFTTLNIFMIYE